MLGDACAQQGAQPMLVDIRLVPGTAMLVDTMATTVVRAPGRWDGSLMAVVAGARHVRPVWWDAQGEVAATIPANAISPQAVPWAGAGIPDAILMALHLGLRILRVVSRGSATQVSDWTSDVIAAVGGLRPHRPPDVANADQAWATTVLDACSQCVDGAGPAHTQASDNTHALAPWLSVVWVQGTFPAHVQHNEVYFPPDAVVSVGPAGVEHLVAVIRGDIVAWGVVELDSARGRVECLSSTAAGTGRRAA